MRIGYGLIQLMSHYVGHGVSAFISVRTQGLGGTTGNTRLERALGGWVSDKGYFYITGRTKRARGMKTAKVVQKLGFRVRLTSGDVSTK